MSHAQIIIQCSLLYSNILSGLETKLKEKSSRSLFANWRLAHIHLHRLAFRNSSICSLWNRNGCESKAASLVFFLNIYWGNFRLHFFFNYSTSALHHFGWNHSVCYWICFFLQFIFFFFGSSIQLAHITHSLKSVCLNSVDKRKIKHKSEHFFSLSKSLCFSVFGKLPSIE